MPEVFKELSEMWIILNGLFHLECSDEVKDKIFGNMSSRLVEMIKEDIEFMGPVRLKDIEDAQQNIVNVIRKLERDGEIITPRGGDEMVL